MEASIVDLRYRMKDVLQALERKEEVTVLHRGKIKGTIVPTTNRKFKDARKHPLFNSDVKSASSIEEEMDKLRGDRFRAL